ncbi:hypothetical protein [Reyranella massiliensis]|uniref:hypothetical protein n=1 Tax=Reyranella massiliensis TaxID=445220 RepID=UPI0002D78867|nr:hypothetical protein [Reyranella massiliensis]
MRLIPNDRTHHMALSLSAGLDALIKIMPVPEDQYELMVLITSEDRLGVADYRWKETGFGLRFYDADDDLIEAGPDYDLNEAILIALRAEPTSMAEHDWWTHAYSVGVGFEIAARS